MNLRGHRMKEASTLRRGESVSRARLRLPVACKVHGGGSPQQAHMASGTPRRTGTAYFGLGALSGRILARRRADGDVTGACRSFPPRGVPGDRARWQARGGAGS
jgi:hypothetical protein